MSPWFVKPVWKSSIACSVQVPAASLPLKIESFLKVGKTSVGRNVPPGKSHFGSFLEFGAVWVALSLKFQTSEGSYSKQPSVNRKIDVPSGPSILTLSSCALAGQ